MRQNKNLYTPRANLVGAAMLVFLLLQQSVALANRLLVPAVQAGAIWPWLLRLVFTFSMSGVTFLFLAHNGGRLGLVVPMKKPQVPTLQFLPWFLFVVLLANYGVNVLYGLLGVAPQAAAFPENTGGLVLYFLTSCVVAPVLEELVFRGGIQGLLQPFGPRCAGLVTTLLFLTVHSGGLDLLAVLVVSLLLCWVRQVSGSVLPCILLHAANNTVGFALRVGQQYSMEFATAFIGVVLNIAFYGSVAAFVWFRMSKFRPLFQLDKTPLRQGLAALRGAKVFWVGAVVCTVYFAARALL